MVVAHVVSPRGAAATGEVKMQRPAPEEAAFSAAVASAVRAVPLHAAAENTAAGVEAGAAAGLAVKQPAADAKSLHKRKSEAAAEKAPSGPLVPAGAPQGHAPVPAAAVLTQVVEDAGPRQAPAAKPARPAPASVPALAGRPAADSAVPASPVAPAVPAPVSQVAAPAPAAHGAAAAAKPGAAPQVLAAGQTSQAPAPAPMEAAAENAVVPAKAPETVAPPVRQAARDETVKPEAAPAAKPAAPVLSASRPSGWTVREAAPAPPLAPLDGTSHTAPLAAATPAPSAAPPAASPPVPAAPPPAPTDGETAKMAAGLAAAVTAMTRDGKTALSMKLDPPALGNLSIHLAVGDDAKVNVLLVAAVPQTAQAFAAGADTLRQAFVNAGIDLGQLNVGGGKADAGAGQQGSGQKPGDELGRQAAPAPDDGVRAIA